MRTLSLQDIAVGTDTISETGKALRTPPSISGRTLRDVSSEELMLAIYRMAPRSDEEGDEAYSGASNAVGTARVIPQIVTIEDEEE